MTADGRRRTGVWVGVARRLALGGLVAVCALVTAMPRAHAQAGDYIVGPQDVLTITVWDQTDLSGKFSVDVDGSFTFPLIGRVQVGGLSLRDLEAMLKARLSDGYFKDPQLTVGVEQYRSQRIFVVGEVRSPGTYALTGEMTLLEAISKAGSATATASDEVVVVRPPVGRALNGPLLPTQAAGENSVRINLRDLQSGVESQNMKLRDGDSIFVPRAGSVYVFGQVKNPGAYLLQSSETTVLQALSLAGGVTARGATSRVHIVRMVNGQKTEIKTKLGDLVRVGDTIIVPERFL